MKKEKKPSGSYYLPIGMCLGLSIGTAIGSAMDNLSVWMSLGMSFGLCIGVLLDRKNRNDSEDADPEEKGDRE